MESERNRTTIIIVKTEYLCGQGMRGGGRGGGQTSRMSFPVASFAPSGKKRGTREREKWKDRRGERERATPRKTDPRKGEKVGKGGGRKIGGRTLSCSPFERERERESGRGRDIRESFAELRGAPFGVPLCSL